MLESQWLRGTLGSVDFSTALLFAKGGMRIRRESWGPTLWKHVLVRDGHLMVVEKGTRHEMWLPNEEDLMATDWAYEDADDRSGRSGHAPGGSGGG